MVLSRPGRSCRSVLGIVLSVGAGIVWMLVGAPAAFADEFAVVVVVGPEAGDSSGATFMDGFRLAVDESPDVSHPIGVEGGDHLGSMDVVIAVVEGVSGSEEIVSAVTDSVAREGTTIVVADLSQPDLEAVIGPLAESETMLIAMSDPASSGLGPTRFFYPVNEQERSELLLDFGGPTFESSFVEAYGFAPTAAATRGYLAGRLVDISVGATDRDPGDEQALAAGLAAATGSISDPLDESTEVGDTATPSDSTAPDPGGTPSSGDSQWPVIILVLAVGAAVALGLYAMLRRR